MKKLLIIPFLLSPSVSYSKEVKINWAEKAQKDCKNWATLEKVPQEESIKCLKSIISQISEQTQANKINIERIYNTFND